MSFAGETKGELCRTALNRKCCTQAEAYGVLLYCNTFSGREIRIITENEAFAQRLPTLFRKAFRLSFDRLPDGEGKYSFGITDPAKLAAVSGTFGMDAGSLANHVNFAVLDCLPPGGVPGGGVGHRSTEGLSPGAVHLPLQREPGGARPDAGGGLPAQGGHPEGQLYRLFQAE